MESKAENFGEFQEKMAYVGKYYIENNR